MAIFFLIYGWLSNFLAYLWILLLRFFEQILPIFCHVFCHFQLTSCLSESFSQAALMPWILIFSPFIFPRSSIPNMMNAFGVFRRPSASRSFTKFFLSFRFAFAVSFSSRSSETRGRRLKIVLPKFDKKFYLWKSSRSTILSFSEALGSKKAGMKWVFSYFFVNSRIINNIYPLFCLLIVQAYSR